MYEKLRQKMNEKGITAYRLARLSGIRNQHLYACFKGKCPLYPAWKKRIAAALDTDESIFEDTTPAERTEGEDNERAND